MKLRAIVERAEAPRTLGGFPVQVVNVEQSGVDEAHSDPSGLLAASGLNRSFIITADLAEGGRKRFRVRAQSERVAREKFLKHHAQAHVISVAEEGVSEFAPAGGGGNIPRGPKTTGRGPWDDDGEDPYQLRRYNRSADFFDQFDSDGVDKQKFDKATGEYEGYYLDRDAASGITQIAYFKFDNPAKTGDNDPGMGWYYEPVDEGVNENANPYGYEVGQTVELGDGTQGTVIDIFGDSIEVQLTTGQSVTVPFQDAQVLDEVSDQTLINYLTKVDADSQKHEKDPTKRSPEKRNRSVAGFSRAFNRLDARKSVAEFVTPQVAAGDPGLEREKDVDVIFYGMPGRDWKAEDGWAALEEVLPQEYPHDPNGAGPAQYKVAEVAKSGGAVVTTKPLSVAKKLVATFNTYGIRSRINESLEEQISRLHQELDEAIKLNAPQELIPRDQLQGYADRIKTGTKTKKDKFAPIIHGSNIKAITRDDGGTEWDLDDLAKQITTRPRAILGTNAKMEKSKTEGEIIYDLTLPALSGIVVDEDTGDFVEIKTCPGAGECQLFCYARKGGYVMFPASSMSAAQALNFLVNDPEGYMAKVNQEITALKARTDRAGIQLVVRWHDAGDFFSKEYLDLAYDIANANPDVKFYAYTKMGDVATGSHPKNFIINFSSGSKSREVKKVEIHKQAGNTVKQGVTVPKDMFFDLIARKGNSLIKDAKGRTQFASPAALETFKDRLAQKYGVDRDSIITYDEMLSKPEGPRPQWNVIVQPGAGDRAANRLDVIDSYLMFH